jgi:hypothetical protein
MDTQQAMTIAIVIGGVALTVLIYALALRMTIKTADGEPIPIGQACSAIAGALPLVFLAGLSMWGLTFLPVGGLHLSNDDLRIWGPVVVLAVFPVVVAGIVAQRYDLGFSNAIVRVFGAFLIVALCAFALASFVGIARAAL